MSDGADDPIEEELRELEAELSEEADGDGVGDVEGDVSGDVDAAAGRDRGGDAGPDLDDLGTGRDDPAGDDATGSVGLDRDPSEQYADLLDGDAAAGSDASADRGASAGVEPDAGSGSDGAGGRSDDGGLLSGLLGDGDDPAAEAPESAGDAAARDSDAGAGGLRARLASYFSPRAFLAAALLATVLAGVGRVFVPLPLVGGAAGVWLATFLVGLASGRGRYLECAVAGALVGALGAVAAGVSVAIAAGATERLLLVGGVGGLLAAVVGHYFGSDLRAGLVGGADWSEPEP